MKRKFVETETSARQRNAMKSFGGLTQQEKARISSNKAAAILVRQAKMSAMPVQRANINDRGYVDTGITTFDASTTGSVTLLATIAQGASVNQRVGKKIMYNSIQIRGRCNAGSTTGINEAALIIIYDKRPTGALPAITDLLVISNVNAMNNDDNSGRFQIVRRREVLTIGNTTTLATGREAVDCNDFIKFKRPAVYKSVNTGAIGDIEEGALYLVTVGNVAAGTAAASFVLNFRVRFDDTH